MQMAESNDLIKKEKELKLKTLKYEDKDVLAPMLRAKNSYLSEYSFTNAYLFREPHKYETVSYGDCLFLKGVTYDGFSYIMPVCPLEKVPLEKILLMAEEADFFFPIQEDWLHFFPEKYFEYSFAEGDSDYIYLTERLASMAGRKLSSKRNLLKQYKENYEIKDLPLSQELFGDAKSVLDTWEREIREHQNHGSDYEETLEALKKMAEFNLFGMISYANGNPAGFVLGEELNDETFVLHFAKGSREYKGIFQHLYNSFAKTLIGRYKFMNFEQDLGKDSLRQAKSTYYPDNMMIKYRVRLKK